MTFRYATAKVRRRSRRSTQVHTRDKVNLKGGLDLVTSVEALSPGNMLACRNYEPYFVGGGYRRLNGYEIFDGQLRPHLAEYWKVDLTSISAGPFQYGETVTAVLAGFDDETAIVVEYEIDTEAADDTGYMIITNLSNDVDEDAVWTGGTSGATGTGLSASEFQGQDDEDLHDQAQLAAEDYRRSFITEVGLGSCIGQTKGVNVYDDTVYAFRNLTGDTEGSMWKSTTSGWEQIALGFKVRFENGTTEPNEGDTITGVSTGATCVIQRVVVTAGMFPGDDAVGYVVTGEVLTGPFIAGEDLQVGGETFAVADASLPQVTQTLPPDGRYRFRNYNFGGHSSTFRMYGVNGEGQSFEFDGTVFVLIETGMDVDKPTHIGVHRGHVLLAFPGGSLQHSGKNKPLSFQPVLGANEIMAGDEVTGFIEEVGDVSFVFTRNKTFRLEGFVQENIQLKLHNTETGAISDSIQRIGRSVYLDDRGFTQLPATDAFGDFASNQISLLVDPLIRNFLKSSTVDASVINRGQSMYRCFFSNKGAISIGFSGNQVNGITAIDYGLSITDTANGEMTNEEGLSVERLFLSDEDGNVFEIDVGRNFNGEPLEAYFMLAYHFSGQPEYNKRYRRATLYIRGEGRTTIRISADYNYNEDAQNFERILDEAVPLGGGRYGIDRHHEFLYARASEGDIRVPMDSHARNVSLIFYHNEVNEEPHICDAVHYHLSRRRLIRS